MRTWPVLAVAAVAAALGGCGGGSEEAAELAFVSSRDGVYTIYVMGANGGGERRLTGDEAPTPDTLAGLFYEIEPAWSPDGSQVAFASRRGGNFDIYVTGADGTGTRRLTSARADETHPTWSPDGTRIAFQRGNPSDIYVMNVDGSNPHRLVQLDANEVDPTWSPDGEWIAYQLRRPGTELGEIHVVAADGSRGRRLTSLQRSAAPAWSADGERIAFASRGRGRNFDIYTVGLDGKGLRRVTTAPEDEFEPAFSPDGGSIAFDRAGAIVVTGADGEEQELTDADNNDGSPVWRPAVDEQDD